MNVKIGYYEAKTRLPELLREVQSGKRYTITFRGKAIADLIPAGAAQKINGATGVVYMQKLMISYPPIFGIGGKALIEDGRD